MLMFTSLIRPITGEVPTNGEYQNHEAIGASYPITKIILRRIV